MASYTYQGPSVRIPYPSANDLLRLKAGRTYEFPEGALPGLMDHNRPIASGRLVPIPAPVAPAPVAAALPPAPKATATATKPKTEPKADPKPGTEK